MKINWLHNFFLVGMVAWIFVALARFLHPATFPLTLFTILAAGTVLLGCAVVSRK